MNDGQGWHGPLVRSIGLVAIALASTACNASPASSTATPMPTSIVDPCTIVGALSINIMQVSMEPTLEPGDKVVLEPASFYRGEIVVFPAPAAVVGSSEAPFIKRVIGVAGDLVEIHDDAVWVNSVKLVEPYVYNGQPTTPLTDTLSWRVPQGYLFVLGDHREASQDSRVFGPIATSAVIGRVAYRCLPADRRGPISASLASLAD